MKKLDIEIRQVNNGFIVYHGLLNHHSGVWPEMWVAENMSQLLKLLSELYLVLEENRIHEKK